MGVGFGVVMVVGICTLVSTCVCMSTKAFGCGCGCKNLHVPALSISLLLLPVAWQGMVCLFLCLKHRHTHVLAQSLTHTLTHIHTHGHGHYHSHLHTLLHTHNTHMCTSTHTRRGVHLAKVLSSLATLAYHPSEAFMHAFTDAAAAAVPDLSAHAAAELAWGVARCDRSPGRVHARGFAGRLAAAGLHGAAAVAVSAMGGGNGGSLPVGASPKLSMLRATRGPKTLNSNIISSGGGGGRNNNSDPFRGGFKNILSGERDDAAAPAAATPAAAAAAAASPAKPTLLAPSSSTPMPPLRLTVDRVPLCKVYGRPVLRSSSSSSNSSSNGSSNSSNCTGSSSRAGKSGGSHVRSPRSSSSSSSLHIPRSSSSSSSSTNLCSPRRSSSSSGLRSPRSNKSRGIANASRISGPDGSADCVDGLERAGPSLQGGRQKGEAKRRARFSSASALLRHRSVPPLAAGEMNGTGGTAGFEEGRNTGGQEEHQRKQQPQQQQRASV